MSEGHKRASYEAPSIAVVGTLHGHTLARGKAQGEPNDGDFINRVSLTTVS